MERNTFLSCSNCFDRLRRKTRNIDEGIERLSETWKTPQLLIGCYAERTAETNACLEGLWESIRNTGVAVEKLQSKLDYPSLDKTDQLLDEFQAMYKDLKEQCDNLNFVLAEYGYQYDESNGQENHSRNYNQDSMNDSVFNTEETLDMEVEFTPHLTWKCKAKSRESDSFNANQRNPIIKSIATPVLKNLESVLQSEILNTNKLFINEASVQKSNYLKLRKC